MQSVSLNKSLAFLDRPWMRGRHSLLPKRIAGGGGHASMGRSLPMRRTPKPRRRLPKPKRNIDLGMGGFYQVTDASNGNFIREDTTESGGALWSVFASRTALGWDMKRTSATPSFPRLTTRA